MPDLTGKILIITGSTQGVGEGVAMQAAECGAAGIVTCGRNRANGESVAAALQEKGCHSEYVQADLGRVEDCRRVVKTCDEIFGRVDGLVNAAGLTTRGTLDDTTVDLWDELFAVNTRAPFLLTQETVRIMKREKIAGSIVNILSVAAPCGLDYICAYSATKGALSTFTKNTAESLLSDRIRVNGINLGWTDTPNEHKVQVKMGRPKNWMEIAESRLPFGRLIKTYDMGHLCAYLLSEESGLMTGALIDYDQRVIGAYGNLLADKDA